MRYETASLLDRIRVKLEMVKIFNLFYVYAGDACIEPTDNRDFIVPNQHNRRVEACFDRQIHNV